MSAEVQANAEDALRTIGVLDADAIDPIDGALWLAKWAEPSLNLDPYRRHIDTLVSDARAYLADDRRDDALALEAARQILDRRYGYRGAQSSSQRNDEANITRTIDRRRGNATVLALMYRHVLRALEREVVMIDFAPRTLVGVFTGGTRTLIDPFDGGRIVHARELRRLLKAHQGESGELTPRHLVPMTPRQALLSLQTDIKVHHLLHAAPEAALMAVQAAVLIAPDEAYLWRELALLHERLDQLLDATRALERFLQLPGGAAHRYTASQMLQTLRRRIESNRTP
ncbi:tetratricopeptide repeat protein [Magnetovibrio sp.]|uniref:transglutaminase family protein n=1 Tax=Magnetovibrio sp. TaxID=2024836 RepID=UPI002F925E8F